jgi:hypothetical protein
MRALLEGEYVVSTALNTGTAHLNGMCIRQSPCFASPRGEIRHLVLYNLHAMSPATSLYLAF